MDNVVGVGFFKHRFSIAVSGIQSVSPYIGPGA